jgi:uncharacterized membrane-anchored protein
MNEPKKIKTSEVSTVSFRDYFHANLFFWGLLLVAAVITFFTCGAVWDDVTQGAMEFLFVIMGGGFTMVSVLDYFYEIKIASVPSDVSKTR